MGRECDVTVTGIAREKRGGLGVEETGVGYLCVFAFIPSHNSWLEVQGCLWNALFSCLILRWIGGRWRGEGRGTLDRCARNNSIADSCI